MYIYVYSKINEIYNMNENGPSGLRIRAATRAFANICTCARVYFGTALAVRDANTTPGLCPFHFVL